MYSYVSVSTSELIEKYKRLREIDDPKAFSIVYLDADSYCINLDMKAIQVLISERYNLNLIPKELELEVIMIIEREL